MRKSNRKHAKPSESREHSVNHRFDGHKLAAGVNHNFDMRHASPVNIPRTGQRHK